MWRVVLVVLVTLTITGCGGGPPITDRLNGTWSNELVKYQFDFTANTFTRTALGTTETKPMTIVSQDAQSITVRTDGDPITITLVDDTTATIGQPGKIPLRLKRQL